MSEPTTQTPPAPPAPPPEDPGLAVGADPASQMGAILDFLVPETSTEEPGEGGETPPAAPAQSGQQPPAAKGTDDKDQQPGSPGVGAGSGSEVPAGGEPPAAGDAGGADAGPESGAGDLDATALKDKWGEVTTAFETKQAELFKNEALEAVRGEYEEYFNRLNQHPRQLVGQEVQSISGQGKEKLRDAQDAKDWQDAVKHLLVQEVEARATTLADERKDVFTTVHSSIDLFRNNVDLIPGTKQFDRELADQFATFMKDYELRSSGKLVGYSIPVQPMINQIRASLVQKRAAPAAPAAPAADQGKAGTGAPAPAPTSQNGTQGSDDGPQAGVTSKAGSQSSNDDVAAGLMEAFYRQNGMTI